MVLWFNLNLFVLGRVQRAAHGHFLTARLLGALYCSFTQRSLSPGLMRGSAKAIDLIGSLLKQILTKYVVSKNSTFFFFSPYKHHG